MTEILNKEFSRKSFVKGGGAMIVGFSLARRRPLGAKTAQGRRGSRTPPPARSTPGDRLVADDPRRQHGHAQAAGQGRARPGQLTGLLMIAAEELDVSLGQMKPRSTTTRTSRRTRARRPAASAIQTGGLAVRARRGGARRARCSTSPPRTSASRSRASRVNDGVVSGGGKTVTYGALLGDKLFNVRMPPAARSALARRARAGTKPSPTTSSSAARASSASTSRPRSPARSPTPQHPRAGHGPRPRRPAARPGRVRRRHRAEGALDRRELDQEHRRRAGRALRGLRRRRRRPGVRGDPGCGAAQGEVGRHARRIAAVGNLFKQMRDHDAAGKAPARIARQLRQLRQRRTRPRRRSCRRATSTTTRARCRSARAAASPTSRRAGARIFTNSQSIYRRGRA